MAAPAPPAYGSTYVPPLILFARISLSKPRAQPPFTARIAKRRNKCHGQ